MEQKSISAAINTLEELLMILDRAFWEANALNVKDAIYDCISATQKEVSELNKLSIQDHHLAYEPISTEFILLTRRMSSFRKYLESNIMRSSTLTKLDSSTAAVVELITPVMNAE